MEQRCKVCQNDKDNEIVYIDERQIGGGKEKFAYLLCNKCGTLQRNEVVKNIEDYYPNTYYAFQKNIKYSKKLRILLKKMIGFFIIHSSLPISIRNYLIGSKFQFVNALCGTHLSTKSKILDVGCGNGKWLHELYEIGFMNLTGVDLFAVPVTNEFEFIQGTLTDIENETYDCITLNHSFEHMDNPAEILDKIHSLLEENGICILRIPIMGKYAWKKFRNSWYQIDAPRHSFLYTEAAVADMCARHALKIDSCVFDSSSEQIWISEQYQNTALTLHEIECSYKGSKKNIKLARKLNRKNQGDQCIFYITKKCTGKDRRKEKRNKS